MALVDSFDSADRLIEEQDLLKALIRQTGRTSRRAFRAWLGARDLRIEGKKILQGVRGRVAISGRTPVDPEDDLSDKLLNTQKKLTEAMPEDSLVIGSPWGFRLAWRGIQREFRATHRILGQARTLVMEHDADCSPVLEETFESPDDLLKMLDQDAA